MSAAPHPVDPEPFDHPEPFDGEPADPPASPNPDPLYDVPQAAAYLCAPPRFIRRLVYERRIRVTYIGGRIRLRESDLAAYIEANTQEAEPGTEPPARRSPTGPAHPRAATPSPARRAAMPQKVRKITTEAAPTRRPVHTEPAERVTPATPSENAGPVAE